jgi:hypothetical protein
MVNRCKSVFCNVVLAELPIFQANHVIGSADAPIAGQGKGNIHKLIHHSVSSLVLAKKNRRPR